jgi:hypothetical protein
MPRSVVRIAPAALLLLAAACAASPDPGISPTNQTTSQVFTGTEGLPTTVTTDAPVASTINTAIRPDTALVMLQAAYAANGIEVTLIEPREGKIGNPRFFVHGSLNHEPLSRYVNCGQTLTTNHADHDQIQMSVVTTVRPGLNGGSVIETLLTATAQDRTSGNVGDMIPCSTRGALESRIHRAAFGTG